MRKDSRDAMRRDSRYDGPVWTINDMHSVLDSHDEADDLLRRCAEVLEQISVEKWLALAHYLDRQDAKEGNTGPGSDEVQKDIRKYAGRIAALLTELKEVLP